MTDNGICQGVCGVKVPRALFASGVFSVCMTCLTNPRWKTERARREREVAAESREEKPSNIVGRISLVRG